MSSFLNQFHGAYSFGTSERTTFLQTKDQLDNPGPGAYKLPSQAVNKKVHTGIVFANSERICFEIPESKQQVPAAGTYNISEALKLKSPTYAFGQKYRPDKVWNLVNPMTYKIKSQSKETKPSYSFGYKADTFSLIAARHDAPGPGAYSVDTPKDQPALKKQLSQISKGSSKTDREGNFKKHLEAKTTPGPGHYLPLVNPLIKHCAKFTTAERNAIFKTGDKENSLGPGSYFQNEESFDSKKKQGFSISSRQPDKSNNSLLQNPGPGTYNPKEHDTKRTCLFQSSNRQPIDDSLGYPGPGTYDLVSKKQFTPHPTFGVSKRPPLNIDPKTPGVGNYEIRSTLDGPKVPFVGKKIEPFNMSSLENPGPGKYLQNDDANSSLEGPKYCFGGKHSSKEKYIPGPGQYNINRDMEGYQYSFGQKSEENTFKHKNPGPGSYEILPTIATMPNYLNQSKILKLNTSKLTASYLKELDESLKEKY